MLLIFLTLFFSFLFFTFLAIYITDEVTLQDKEKLQDFMRYTAYYLVAAQQTQTAHGAEGIHFLN
jgi:hypothetical protein